MVKIISCTSEETEYEVFSHDSEICRTQRHENQREEEFEQKKNRGEKEEPIEETRKREKRKEERKTKGQEPEYEQTDTESVKELNKYL